MTDSAGRPVAAGRTPGGTGLNAADLLRELIDDAPFTVTPGPVWVNVTPDSVPLAEQGWKLHISARPATAVEVIRRTTDVLLTERCHFKVIASGSLLERLNDGLLGTAQVGKAMTVYPADDEVARIGRLLVDALDGLQAPRVLSDRRISPTAPVYYRYGPFVSNWEIGESNEPTVRLRGPAGEIFEATASMEYRQPEWSTDPFDGSDLGQGQLLGGRYQVESGIHQSARGNVFAAVDLKTNQRVVVKQARAFVGENTAGDDVRSRLRNERRVLEALAPMPGVPSLIDHFAHGDDEYLVTSHSGDENLQVHAMMTGRYRVSVDPAENQAATGRFVLLAQQLAEIVKNLHARGVVMRDLTPLNVVVGAKGPTVIDFGISALAGFHLYGLTDGFAPWHQGSDATPLPSDDCHALGMTLAAVATGLGPVGGRVGPGVSAGRMLRSLVATYGAASIQVATVAALVDPERAEAALATLAAGEAPTAPKPTPYGLPAVSDNDIVSLIPSVIERIIAGADSYGSVDCSIYTGSAGVGLELLHHLSEPGVPDLVQRLVRQAQLVQRKVGAAPGLYVGATGVEVFLRRAAALGIAVDPSDPPSVENNDDDLLSGSIGVAVGQLLLGSNEPRIDHLLDFAALRLASREERLPSGAAVDVSRGYAHGLAGVVDLYRAYLERTGDQRVDNALHTAVEELTTATEALAHDARRSAALPMSVSWCQGLSGIAPALQRAAPLLSNPPLRSRAERLVLQIADTVEAWTPRIDLPTRCCGSLGGGEFFVDLWQLTGDERHQQRAYAVLGHLLLRNTGPDGSLELFPAGTDSPLSWGRGDTGLLTFLRRLRDGNGFALTP